MPIRGQRYRLNIPTLAIIKQDGHNAPITIPSGAVVKITSGPLDGDRLIDVIWDGKVAMMFTTDILERGVRLEELKRHV
jgi:late competence protein required for DNA uptake (superfamily II DNA/RNA helicase)